MTVELNPVLRLDLTLLLAWDCPSWSGTVWLLHNRMQWTRALRTARVHSRAGYCTWLYWNCENYLRCWSRDWRPRIDKFVCRGLRLGKYITLYSSTSTACNRRGRHSPEPVEANLIWILWPNFCGCDRFKVRLDCAALTYKNLEWAGIFLFTPNGLKMALV